YFSIGDRGLRVTTREGKLLDYPDQGSVLRCEPDGSKLEIFATGFRNPQELAFDEYGNLFTCDNNSDSGDRARWLHIVEGGDYGWRIGYQFFDVPTPRGPWNNEMLWKPDVAKRAAWIMPPIANFSDGPSGLAYHPGTSRLGDEWAKTFFLCDFRGTANQSGIRTVKLKPNGATFEIEKDSRIVWQSLVTDCEFGPDGALYFSDWVEGWAKPGKGRLYKFTANDQPLAHRRDAEATQALLQSDLSSFGSPQLAVLFMNPDVRVRKAAQFALAARKDAATAANLLDGMKSAHVAEHATWCLGQILRANPGEETAATALVKALGHSQPTVQAIAAQIAGDQRLRDARAPLLKALAGAWPTVRMQAGIALGKLGADPATVGELLAALPKAVDPTERHGLVLGLAGAASRAELVSLKENPKSALRLAAVLALRRQHDAGAAEFLRDTDPLVALEAARAIHDAWIPAAFAKLAAETENPAYRDDPYLRRALAANYRIGDASAATRAAKLATRSDIPASVREEALYQLTHWAKPNGKDRVLGVWRPIPERSADPAAKALEREFDAIKLAADPESRRLLVAAVAALGVTSKTPAIRELARSESQPAAVRNEALKALATMKDGELAATVRALLASPTADVRNEARRQLAKLDPAAAVASLEQVVATGATAERQAALATLATIKRPEADAPIASALDLLFARKTSRELELDVLEAAAKRPALSGKLAEW
ncbi:MAG TPA: HEAT repeat domain-containing protein, partial [Planctomycetia bacterium]|nr:HEAT repeat domain-containing protein [Planctomycetia bacterium]